MSVSPTPNRSQFTHSRLFYIGIGMETPVGWYLETREGIRGPFDSRESAMGDLGWLMAAHPHSRVDNWHRAA